jgi:hypothetical protein
LVAKNIERLGDSAAAPAGDTTTAPARASIAALAPEAAPVAAGNKFHIGINFWPLYSTFNSKIYYGSGIAAGYSISGLSVGIAPQFVSLEEGKKEYDLMLRVAYAYTVMPKLAVYVEVLPGYSIVTIPYCDNPKGLVLAFGAGATFDITGHLFANFGIGYQKGYQAIDGDKFYSKFLRIAVGLGMKF